MARWCDPWAPTEAGTCDADRGWSRIIRTSIASPDLTFPCSYITLHTYQLCACQPFPPTLPFPILRFPGRAPRHKVASLKPHLRQRAHSMDDRPPSPVRARLVGPSHAFVCVFLAMPACLLIIETLSGLTSGETKRSTLGLRGLIIKGSQLQLLQKGVSGEAPNPSGHSAAIMFFRGRSLLL